MFSAPATWNKKRISSDGDMKTNVFRWVRDHFTGGEEGWQGRQVRRSLPR